MELSVAHGTHEPLTSIRLRAFSSQLSAVNKQQNAIHVIRVGRCQERSRSGDIVRQSKPASGNQFSILAHKSGIFQEGLRQTCPDQSWTYGVRLYAVVTQFSRHGFGQQE